MCEQAAVLSFIIFQNTFSFHMSPPSCVVFMSRKSVECCHAFLHTSCFLRADFFFMNSVVVFIDPNILSSLTQLENFKK